ncbi:MAG: MoxR family ATPase [Brevinematales bacterium]|nr:MoxR family ATPase [Brevinematales bacterium]
MVILNELKKEKSKIIVGQDDVFTKIVASLFAGGHVLMVGVPGLAKTLLANTVAKMFDLEFRRVQFTPDLMPADIIGFDIIEEDPETGKKVIKFHKGPIFTNILLADEINRASPKTQSALLESMQEKKVTTFGKTYILDDPFFVIATQNPLEQEGTYPLPEAQLDRFMIQINMRYPSFEEELEICKITPDISRITPIVDLKSFFEYQREIDKVFVSDKIVEYIVRIVRNTRPSDSDIPKVKEFVDWGAGPRASQHLLRISKSLAFLRGDKKVIKEYVDEIVFDVLRHRVILNYSAKIENVSPEDVILSVIQRVSSSI